MPDMFQTLSYRGPHHSTCSLGYMETSIENFKAVLSLGVDMSKVIALTWSKQHQEVLKADLKDGKVKILEKSIQGPL